MKSSFVRGILVLSLVLNFPQFSYAIEQSDLATAYARYSEVFNPTIAIPFVNLPNAISLSPLLMAMVDATPQSTTASTISRELFGETHSPHIIDLNKIASLNLRNAAFLLRKTKDEAFEAIKNQGGGVIVLEGIDSKLMRKLESPSYLVWSMIAHLFHDLSRHKLEFKSIIIVRIKNSDTNINGAPQTIRDFPFFSEVPRELFNRMYQHVFTFSEPRTNPSVCSKLFE